VGFIDSLSTSLENGIKAEDRIEHDPSLLNIYFSCILQKNFRKNMEIYYYNTSENLGPNWDCGCSLCL